MESLSLAAIPTTLDMEHFCDIGSPEISYANLSSPLMDTADTTLPPISTIFPHGHGHQRASDSLCSDGSFSEDSADDNRVYTELKTFSDVNQPCLSPLPKKKEKVDLFGPDIDSAPMDSWLYKHPEEWGSKEILDWIYSWLPKLSANGSDVDCCGENFSKLDGRQLIKMSEEEFCELEPNYGKMYYNMLHKLLQESMFKVVDQDMDFSEEELKNFINGENEKYLNDSMFHTYDYDQDGFNDFKTEQDDGYESTSSGEYRDQIPATVQACEFLEATDPCDLPGNRNTMAPFAHTGNVKPTMGRPRVRPTSESSVEDAVPAPKKRGRRLGQVSNKGNHLWEFIRDLLKSPLTNPSHIRWEDEENGVFRIVQSKKVSELWGKKKNNPAMNYEKLSRAMRHYYKSEILIVVLGRRLVYRFGKNATGWQKTAAR